jgi:hypothetical protein
MFFLCILATARLTGASEPKPPFPLLEAEKFLRQLYPELGGRGYIMSVELSGAFDLDWTSMPRFSVELGPTELGHVQHSIDRSGKLNVVGQEPVLGALFEFASDGILQATHVSSPGILSDARNERLRKLVDSHRDWSDTQVIESLKKSGIKFGPEDREAFLRNLHLDRLQPFTGNLHVESAEFRLRHQQPSGSSALLYWEVDVVSQEPSGNPAHWTLIFEPVGGRLSSVVRYFSNK